MFNISFGSSPYIPREDKLKAQVEANLGLAAACERRSQFAKAEAFFNKAMKAATKLQQF